jgi:predicted anti-sigma-YlaC factor YlaD
MQVQDSRRPPAERSDASRRTVRVLGVSVGVVVVLLWPVQSIVVLMLLASVVLMVDLYGRWTHRHALGARQRRSFRRAMSAASFLFLGVGLVAAVLWPTPMVLIGIIGVVTTCLLWCAVSSVVWLVAMEHDLTSTEPHAPRPVAPRPRRPRPAAASAPLPRPHPFGSSTA